MKKNYLFGLFAMATMLFTASCQEEDLVGTSDGNTATVTFEVSTPTIATRAVGDGTTAKKLYVGVYENQNGELNGPLDVSLIDDNEPVAFDDNRKATVNLALAKNKEYSVIFWAETENNADAMFGIDWVNRKLTLKSSLKANQESYDAFWAQKDVNLNNGNISEKVELKRPFAQLNIGTSDKEIAKAAGIIVDRTEVKTKVFTTFNLQNGTAADEAEVTYKMEAIADIEGESFPTAATEQSYLSLNYLLMNADKSIVDVTFSYMDEEDDNAYELKFNSVPVQRNYRTNIYGTLLTNSANYTVEILPGFADEEHNVLVQDVATAEELHAAIEEFNNSVEDAELSIVLTDDIDLNDLFGGSNAPATRAAGDNPSVTLAKGKSLILDLNGKTITATDKSSASFAMITNHGNLTINDATGEGAIKLTAENDRGWSAYSSVISNQPGGKLTVNGGTIKHLGGTAMAYAIDNLTNGKGTYAETIINGGVIESTYRPIRMFLNGVEAENILTVNAGTIESTGGNRAAIWMQDPSANANTGTLYVGANAVINNGVYLDVTEGSTEWPVTVSIAADALKHAEHKVITENLPVGYSVEEIDGVYKVVITYVAKIGEVDYTTLKKAVDAVEDGGTITLVANETFTKNNYSDNGGWRDGIAYSGDKSFTIDLNGYTVSQDGYLNDYLFWFKNAGSKENTITIKNGTLDAGTTAFCALCTANAHDNKLTVNTENVNLINNINNGSTVKIRAGSVYNAKAGTKITGKNSYLGIENWKAEVNIYDGVEIYMNGTSSYNGCLVGVGGNGTVNVYGGYGKGVSGGLIAMTSGGTINVEGGEWIANTDGTFANSNKSVLIAQSDKQYNAGAGNAVVNVTGGTFKGGYNCYGNKVGDAQINIKGGNFNADPTNYVVAGYEVTGNYTVGKPKALAEFEAAIANGGNVTLSGDVTLLEKLEIKNKVVLDLNGKTITAPLFSAFEVKNGGELTLKNGKVVAYESTVRAIGGKVIVESGEYTSTGTALDSPATYRYSLDCREGGELVINGGTFKSNNGMINVSSTVTINGGKFENIVEKTMTRHFAYVSAPLIINDGEFYGKANGSAGGCFFCGAAAGGDIQINGGKFTSLWTSGSVNKIFEVYFGGKINVTGGMFNTNGGIATFVTENTDEATKAAYPYVAK